MSEIYAGMAEPGIALDLNSVSEHETRNRYLVPFLGLGVQISFPANDLQNEGFAETGNKVSWK